ncbi:MAG TPA: hypothetical protein VKZ84_07970 [Bacteriovoracaceae bacterium]|nr:hypothetical protein [Bacteriovoracaceae bacterium]
MSVRLALIGRGISHSQSPHLHKEIWGELLTGYDLIDVDQVSDLPSLPELSKKYIGINVTTPYKEAYIEEVTVESEVARLIGAINTISLADMSAVNTDAIAVEKILKEYLLKIPQLRIHLLGAGVMARMTKIISSQLGLRLFEYTRQLNGDLSNFDLSNLDSNDLVINSCSRSFVYQGPISSECHFWDYNYSFSPHNYLHSVVKSYQDGQELLLQQAISAANFWRQKAKLNY